jgi:hypothetical protein
MHHLSSIYLVSQHLHVSGVFIVHHQEVFTVYVQQLVRVICLGDWLLVGSGWNQFQQPVNINIQHVPIAVNIQ